MEQCPKCGCYMNFNMTYCCGLPVIFYTCPHCGFDTRSYETVASTSVNPSMAAELITHEEKIVPVNLKIENIYKHKSDFSDIDDDIGEIENS